MPLTVCKYELLQPHYSKLGVKIMDEKILQTNNVLFNFEDINLHCSAFFNTFKSKCLFKVKYLCALCHANQNSQGPQDRASYTTETLNQVRSDKGHFSSSCTLTLITVLHQKL